MARLNGVEEHGECGSGAAITVARPVLPVRHRLGTVGQAARTVHLISVSIGKAGAVGALCGALLRIRDIELANPG
ncbi:MAG: hypothetical protein WCC38_06810 [Pseudonocardiaceae bacterium]